MNISQEIKEIRLNIEQQTKRLKELEGKQANKPQFKRVGLRFYSNNTQDESLFVHADGFIDNNDIDVYLDHDGNIESKELTFGFGFAAVYKDIVNNKHYVIFTAENEYLNSDFDYTSRLEYLCNYIMNNDRSL